MAGWEYTVIQDRDAALSDAADDLAAAQTTIDDFTTAFDACKTARDDAVDWVGRTQDSVDDLRSTGYWGYLDNVDQTLGYAADVDECDDSVEY